MTITIPGQIIKMDVETGIEPVWYDKFKVLFESANLFDSLFGSGAGSSHITNSLPFDVLLNNTAAYFDGPSIGLGTTGTWWVSGTVTLGSTVQDNILVKLWDGTTVVASATTTVGGSLFMSVSLSGYITNPAANLKISARDFTSTNGRFHFNASANFMDSTISAFRIA